jgi:hypothetical protein
MPTQAPSRWEGLVVIATVSGMFTAQVLKSKLEAAGIQSILSYESAGLVFGITLNGLQLSQVQILVAEPDVERARQVLDSAPEEGWEPEPLDETDD